MIFVGSGCGIMLGEDLKYSQLVDSQNEWDWYNEAENKKVMDKRL